MAGHTCSHLAAINIGFSLIDPIILGKLINLAASKVQCSE